MNAGSYNRKISAIWSADVAGYSRLMGDDEEGTVQRLTRYREVMSDLIGQHRGRVVDSPGDNLLAEFSSVVDSLRCAWDVQQELANMNTELPENRRMHFRIGLNLGDVIEEQGKLYGDGVNVAARLENLAEPGGIHLSGAVYDQVKNKLPFQFEFTGEQQVKNIKDPVRAYRVVMGSELPPGRIQNQAKSRKLSRAGMLFLPAAAIAVLGLGFYYWVDIHGRSLSGKSPANSTPLYTLSQRASIAVLPFKNLSGDSEQEYFDSSSPRNVWWHLGIAYYLKERYEKALDTLEEGLIKRPNFTGYHIALAATYARLGRPEEAARAAVAVRRLDPFFEVASFGTGFRQPAHRDAIVAGLREAGLK
jgi:adenylate cyclase